MARRKIKPYLSFRPSEQSERAEKSLKRYYKERSLHFHTFVGFGRDDRVVAINTLFGTFQDNRYKHTLQPCFKHPLANCARRCYNTKKVL